MTIKYQIKKERLQIVNPYNSYTTNELEANAVSRTYRYPLLLGEADDIKKAKKIFEKEKSFCEIGREKIIENDTLLFYDFLSLEKRKYDENGKLDQSYLFDSYIKEEA